jgi:predicted N-acetyltransferase YhbS
MPAGCAAPPVHIGLLADHPEALPTVTRWLHRAWMRHYGYSPGAARAEVRSRMGRDTLPLALVARVGARVVGTVSISADTRSGAQPPPWCLAGLYVTPRWRHRGLAKRLCAAASDKAARLGVRALGLYTLDQAAFFRSQGWQPEGEVALLLSGVPTVATFMRRDLQPAPQRRAG